MFSRQTEMKPEKRQRKCQKKEQKRRKKNGNPTAAIVENGDDDDENFAEAHNISETHGYGIHPSIVAVIYQAASNGGVIFHTNR